MVTLAMAIPFSGRNLPPKLLRAFSAMTPPMNTNVVQMETGGKPIDEARNFFVEQALNYHAKYLFFWDEDVLVPPHALRELMFIAEHYPKYGVIGGIYALKSQRPEPLVFRGTGKGPYWDWRVGEVFECEGIGMGCTLIRMEIFADLEKPYFKTVDDQSAALDNVRYGESWTEDLYFCKKLVETKKWKIAAHGQLLCPHIDINTGQEYVLSPDSKPFREVSMPVGKLKILDIGCGRNPYRTPEGKTVTVDIREDVSPDYRCDFRRLPFATGEFDVVYSSNTIEHVPRGEALDVLTEWVRVMKPKGELRLLIPNLKLAAKLIADGKMGEHVPGTTVYPLDILYGEQSYATDFHYNGFTRETIEGLLKKLGFKRTEYKEGGYEYMIRAWKTNGAKKAKKK